MTEHIVSSYDDDLKEISDGVISMGGEVLGALNNIETLLKNNDHELAQKIIIIGGTAYTGEIKKSIFSVLNFILPLYENVLPMHCSSNYGNNGETSIFLDYQELEKQLYLRIMIGSLLVMMNMDGIKKIIYSISKEAVMQKFLIYLKKMNLIYIMLLNQELFWRMWF